MTDLELIENFRDDPESAFRFLYKNVYPKVSDYIIRVGGSDEDAKDIFQDSIIRFNDLMIRQNFKLECSPTTLIVAISRNLWLNSKRKVILDPIFLSLKEAMDDKEGSLLDEENSEIKKELLENIFKKLDPVCQKIIHWTYFDRKSDEEIALHFGYSLGYVKVKRFRCLQGLRETFRKELSKIEK